MHALRYFPLVAVSGVDGFAMFVPYLGLVLAAAYVIARIRRPRLPIALLAAESRRNVR